MSRQSRVGQAERLSRQLCILRLRRHYNNDMRILAGTALSSVLILGSALAAEVWLKGDALVSSVEKKVQAFEPTREERRFDQIGWAPGILAAEARAREMGRPVFLFTYDGKIETGRC